jgi:hypothetical protein
MSPRKKSGPQPRFKRRNHGNGHSYTLDGVKVPGVTSVIGILDKPALVGWAAKESASYAIEHWDELAELPMMQRADKITSARFDTNKKATTKGHRIHELGEKLSKGEPVEVPDEYRQPAESYARFLDAWDIETIRTETPICHTEYRYAGTFDAIAYSPRLGTVMLDIKTGGRVYSEVALQLAAYRFADLMIDDEPMIPTDGGVVAHVLADTVDMVPIKQDETITSTFLYLLEVFETWHRRTDWKKKDDPAFDPPVQEPVYPDQFPADAARLAG